MKTGTCYFPTYGAALRYYRPYARANARLKTSFARQIVDQKLNSGEIHIGKPEIKPGQTLSIEDNRYFITEATP